ncbi:hypothetical protein DQ04_25801000, partial [Trypanosoma grayi]|uniref:hypothetical protein n=1 Tax=Trypanosoma grayi TaxID=71804 RepID=UPI0004F49C3F
ATAPPACPSCTAQQPWRRAWRPSSLPCRAFLFNPLQQPGSHNTHTTKKKEGKKEWVAISSNTAGNGECQPPTSHSDGRKQMIKLERMQNENKNAHKPSGGGHTNTRTHHGHTRPLRNNRGGVVASAAVALLAKLSPGAEGQLKSTPLAADDVAASKEARVDRADEV